MSRLQAIDATLPVSLQARDPFEDVAARLEASSRAGDRWLAGYGKNKVRLDHLYRKALPWILPGAKVLDLGCGIGLIGLLLESRGLGNQTHGIEWDPAKARFAQRMIEGSGSNQVVCGHLLGETWPDCTVVTALDVLHYFSPEQQRALIFRIGSHLPKGGRLLLRVMDGTTGGMAIFTRFCERLAVQFGWNLAPSVHWRSLAELRKDLSDAGFRRLPNPSIADSLSGNQILVCEKPTRASGAPALLARCG